MTELKSTFPLTYPTPTPLSNTDLITTSDLTREEDLLHNPFSFRHWWAAIQIAKDAFSAIQKAEPAPQIGPEIAALLGPLASPTARLSLQRLTYLYESALAQFPGSFKLWKSYLHTRMSFVLGKFVQKRRAGGKKKFPDMKDALEDEKEDLEEWEGGLDGFVGYEEWKSLIATFERALMFLPNVSHFSFTLDSLDDAQVYFSISSREYGSCISQYSPIHFAHPFSRILTHAIPMTVLSELYLRLFILEFGYGICCGQSQLAGQHASQSIDVTSRSTHQ